MKKLSNTEAGLKKVLLIKERVMRDRPAINGNTCPLLSIYLSDFLLNCYLQSVHFCNQFLAIF